MFEKKYKLTNWKQFVFSDEHKFKLFSVVNQHNDIMWTNNPNQVPPRETLKYTSTWMAWAAITYEGKTKLVEVKNIINAKDYQVTLQKNLLNEINKMKVSSQWLHQQDGAPPHNVISTQKWLKSNASFIPKEDWSQNSLDLNPIESLWVIVNDRIEDR